MARRRARVVLSFVAAGAAVLPTALVALAGPAQATVTASSTLTRGVVGYGTVHVTAASPPADCTSSAGNPGGTRPTSTVAPRSTAPR